MSVRRLTVLLTTTAFYVALAGVSYSQTVYPLVVKDEEGHRLILRSRPERIVSLALPTDEILLDLVGPSRLIGVSTLSTDPGVSNVVGRVGPIQNKLILNVEILMSLNPDLVILANWSNPDSVRQLRDAGVQVYQFRSATTVEDVKETIRRLGVLLDAQDQATLILQHMDERLARVAERIKSIPADRRLSVLDYGTEGGASGRGSSWDEIVRLAGLVNAAARLEADRWGSVSISQEALLQIDPDILVLPGWVWGDPRAAERHRRRFLADPAFQSLRAVRENRVMIADERHRLATSHFIVAAVEDLAAFAYPELFR